MFRENILRAFVAFAILLVAAAHIAGHPEEPKHINVTASKFSFEPSEITVKKGEPIVLTLSSQDATHGLAIKQLGVRVEVHKGQSVDIPISTQTAGTFEGKCAHFCGKGHGSMIFAVHVVE
jgi:cytochrome c oxidase subunit 2